MARQRSIIVVPEARVAAANAAAHTINPEGGDNFSVPLLMKTSPDTKPTPDFRIANWQFEGNQRADFEAACKKTPGLWPTMKIHDLDKPDPAVAKPSKDEVLTIEQLKDQPRIAAK